MTRKPTDGDNEPRGDPVSLRPLRYKEAVADLLKVPKPEGKPEAPKKVRRGDSRVKRSPHST